MRAVRPNILFILIDDLGWADLGCYGSDFHDTPHLDALAARGLRLTDAYAACPVCSPTRASLMTGQYPARIGLTQYLVARSHGRLRDVPYVDHLPPGQHVTLTQALHAGGYATWHVGKWHLGRKELGCWPEDLGFEVNRGGCDWGLPRKGYRSPYGLPTLSDGPDGEYLTDRLTDEAIALIEGHGDDRPWFLHLAHYAVHTPCQAPEDLVERYRAKAETMGRWPGHLGGREGVIGGGESVTEAEAVNAEMRAAGRPEPFAIGEPYPCAHKRDKRVIRRRYQSDPVYAAMVANLDDNIGRLMVCLERRGLLDDTLVIFTSDNGGLATAESSPTCNAPLSEGKGWAEEGGVREPWIAAWPGVIPAGGTSATPITSPDLYPTLLAAAGLPARPEQHRDGVNLLPLLRGGDLPERPLFWHYPHYSNQGGRPCSAVRLGPWKLIEWFEDGRRSLYRLDTDPGEHEDLAGSEPARVADLAALLAAWRQSVSARIPEPDPDWCDRPEA